MHRFVRNLITEWRKLELPTEDATIIVAVSGGADSMSLLAALHDLVKRKKITARVTAAHFNHRLRGTASDDDEAFVREYASVNGFEFAAGAGAIRKKGNLEQNARDARYGFFKELAASVGAAVILTAHTQNDQAETFLLNLIRGSGADGLAGMKPSRAFADDVLLVRPLLSWARREDTEAFCRDSGIDFRSDAMNEDLAFTRVRIRKVVIPALAEMNPRIVETLARTAELVGRGEVETRGREDGETGGRGVASDDEDPRDGALRLSDVRSLPKPELHGTLRSWLRERRGDLRSIQLKHIEAIERLILSRKSGRTAEIPGHGVVVKQSGRLTFTKLKVEK